MGCLMLTNDNGEPRCTFEPLGEYEDCETVWPTTTTTTSSPAGCCFGDSYKANGKCQRATSRDKCEDMGCEFLETEDPSDCDMTTTTPAPTTSTTPSPTVGGCCGSNVSQRKFDMCNAKDAQNECERSAECFWVIGDDAQCDPPVFTTVTPSTVPPGCCRGSSYKAQDKCFGLADENACVRKSCEWVVTNDFDDCEITTTTSSVVEGCCAGMSYQHSKVCNAKDYEQCTRSFDCEFREGETDCSMTTTSEPWLGAQAEAKMSSRRKGRRQESMLFGGESTLSQAMDYQVSLSTVLLLAIAALAVYQTYRWFACRQGYKTVAPVQTHRAQYYQSA